MTRLLLLAHRLLRAAVVYFGLVAAVCLGQTPKVEVSFKYDGRATKPPKKIEFLDDAGHKPFARSEIRDGIFELPAAVLSASGPISVRIRFLGRTMVFADLYPSAFKGTWEIGIDLSPFEQLAYLVKDNEKPTEIWYLIPDTGEGDPLLFYRKIQR
jgi:hypothetical protein